MAEGNNPVPSGKAQHKLPYGNFDPADLTKRFESLLSARRMTELAERARSRPATPAMSYSALPTEINTTSPLPAPAFSSLRNIPKIATPPKDTSATRLRSLLIAASTTPMNYENPGLLDEALNMLEQKGALRTLYAEADEESQILQAQAASISDTEQPEWGYQDCLARALLRWFKRDFMKWVNNPQCSACSAPTVAVGMTPASQEDRARGAMRVELYQCSECTSYERFPRYSDVWTLLREPRGRCGEWANLFTMLCRALHIRARWVWNKEDHVWTEVYSAHQKRWIHVDACEEAWDKPRLYAEGWGKKMSYVIAFSNEGATDVTRRYVRNSALNGIKRDQCPEEVLMYIINEIRQMRRSNLTKDEKKRLIREDQREERELRGYVISALTAGLEKLVISNKPSSSTTSGRGSADIKLPARTTGTEAWRRARNENGAGGEQQQQPEQQPPREGEGH